MAFFLTIFIKNYDILRERQSIKRTYDLQFSHPLLISFAYTPDMVKHAYVAVEHP